MLAYTVSALFLALSATAIKIDTPAINECKPVTFTVTETQGDVHLAVVPKVNPCSSDSLVELGPLSLTDGKYTWDSASLAAGTTVYVVVDDQSGEAWTNEITVGGSASDCPSSATIHSTGAKPASTTSARSSQTSAPVNAANSSDETGAASATALTSGVMVFALGLFTATTLYL